MASTVGAHARSTTDRPGSARRPAASATSRAAMPSAPRSERYQPVLGARVTQSLANSTVVKAEHRYADAQTFAQGVAIGLGTNREDEGNVDSMPEQQPRQSTHGVTANEIQPDASSATGRSAGDDATKRPVRSRDRQGLRGWSTAIAEGARLSAVARRHRQEPSSLWRPGRLRQKPRGARHHPELQVLSSSPDRRRRPERVAQLRGRPTLRAHPRGARSEQGRGRAREPRPR